MTPVVEVITIYPIDKMLSKHNTILCMIYNRVALLRTERDISRQDLADKVGVNYQTIGFIERGDYSPSLELAFKIAAYFKVELTDVFSDHKFPSLFTKKEN